MSVTPDQALKSVRDGFSTEDIEQITEQIRKRLVEGKTFDPKLISFLGNYVLPQKPPDTASDDAVLAVTFRLATAQDKAKAIAEFDEE